MFLEVFERTTREPVATTLHLWRLDAPGNEHWTAGDQRQAIVEVAAGGSWIRELPAGRYRARCVAERRGNDDPQEFVEMFKERPAVHRFPGSMAGRVQALAETVHGDWNGDATAIWTQGDPDGQEVLRRLKALPGFGEQKAKIFLALLGKQCGLQAEGWREAAGHYGQEDAFLSVADIVDPESLGKVRASKQAAKAAAKAAKIADR